jgi:hypothetical protein
MIRIPKSVSPKTDLPEVPGEEGEEKLPDDEEIFNDNTAEDALAPTHKLNGQHEGGLENTRLKINKNLKKFWKRTLARNSRSLF